MDNLKAIKIFLDKKAAEYETIDFIANDPISIPHQFSKKQDIEIAAFFAAVLAWGNRKTIINSCKKLLDVMDNAPYDFICNFEDKDLKPLYGFVHRTFNSVDLFHFLDFLKYHYRTQKNKSLETAFSQTIQDNDDNVENALTGFYQYFFDATIFPDFQKRTQKHIASPQKKSACKRLNMFLRWMARSSDKGVDFGLWSKIKPVQLICPLDVHVQRVALHLGILQSEKNDWQAAVTLTNTLKTLDPNDPVKYDFALFGLGVNGVV